MTLFQFYQDKGMDMDNKDNCLDIIYTMVKEDNWWGRAGTLSWMEKRRTIVSKLALTCCLTKAASTSQKDWEE